MKQGVALPQVKFMTRVRDDRIEGPNPFRWETKFTEDYFAGKLVVLFSLPGAFTPTCSTYQLPGFESNYNSIREMGVDEIYVISVNDSFVMNKWAKDQCIEKVKVIPDGNGEFTRMLGMLVDKSHLGFGSRSWRYAAVVKDGTVEAWFQEPGINNTGSDEDPYGETSPESIMAYLQQAQNLK